MSTAPAGSALSDADYRAKPQLLARIEAATDRWLQQDLIDIDSQRTGGLLEMSFPTAARSSSTPSRRCTRCGWRRAEAAFTTAG
jgi:hypothetical protein